MKHVASFFFLATLFCCTFEKVHWSFGGQIALADLLALCFIATFAVVSRPRVPRTSAVLLGFGAAKLFTIAQDNPQVVFTWGKVQVCLIVRGENCFFSRL
jgi:hypothetical protein